MMISDTDERDLEKVAELCHTLNRAYCHFLGDLSQPTWYWAPEWMKRSAIDGVRFHLANPDAPASASHENWLRHKEAEGWVYGPRKDPERKEHPCMVPFEELPVEQQFKDHLFKCVVNASSLGRDRGANNDTGIHRQ